jgi:hypothetical protein
MATTFVQSGSNVTAIDNIVILGNTYDVTFGNTVDITFGSAALATDAADTIRAALNSDPTDITVGPSDLNFTVCSSSSGSGSCDGDVAANEIEGPGGWNNVGTHTGFGLNVDNPAADFTLVGAPEPGVLTMVVPGLALLLLAGKRRRRPAPIQ